MEHELISWICCEGIGGEEKKKKCVCVWGRGGEMEKREKEKGEWEEGVKNPSQKPHFCSKTQLDSLRLDVDAGAASGGALCSASASEATIWTIWTWTWTLAGVTKPSEDVFVALMFVLSWQPMYAALHNTVGIWMTHPDIRQVVNLFRLLWSGSDYILVRLVM